MFRETNVIAAGRKEETVSVRCRVGYTFVTHSYFLIRDDQLFCHTCNLPLTVKHVFLDYEYLGNIRQRQCKVSSMHGLFLLFK